MPIIKVSDAANFEDHPVSEGIYPLRIVKAEKKQSKAGNPMLQITLKIEGSKGAEAPLLNEYLTIPKEGDQYYRLQMRNISRFFAAFGVDSFDPDSAEDVQALEGLTAECPLILEVGEDQVERNRLRLPKAGRR